MISPSPLPRTAFAAALLSLFLSVASAQPAAAQIAELVADLTPSWTDSNGSRPSQAVPIGNKVLFFAESTKDGNEPWTTDGTSARTVQLVDTCPGPCGASRILGELNGQVLFLSQSESDSSIGTGVLWISDGTRAGTLPLMDSADFSRFPSSRPLPSEQAILDGQIIFRGFSEATGFEPWISDGTREGTRLLVDLLRGPGSSHPSGFSTVQGEVFFTAENTDDQRRLWQTDGSPSGTRSEFPVSTDRFVEAQNFLSSGDGLLIEVDTTEGDELWHRDGEGQFTELPLQPFSFIVEFLTAQEGQFYFFAQTPAFGQEVWRTDGTTAGTERISELPEDASFSPFLTFDPVAVLGPRSIYFQARVGGVSFVFHTNGSPTSTRQVKRSCDGEPDCSPPTSPWGLIPLGDHVAYVTGNSFDGVIEILGQDPEAPTVSAETLCSRSCQPEVFNILLQEGRLFFYSTPKEGGTELWATDGTAAGTRPLARDNNLFGEPASRMLAAPLAGGWLTAFRTQELGDEPYFAEAGSVEARLLLDINHSPTGAEPIGLVQAGQKVVFHARSSDASLRDMWISDGSAQGTARLFPAGESFFPEFVGSAGATAFLARTVGGPEGWEVWATDGDPAGPRRILFQEGGSRDSALGSNYVPFQGEVSFSHSFGAGAGIWRTDATEAGTRRILTLDSASYFELGALGTDGDDLFFLANGSGATDLWTSDGTDGDGHLLATVGNSFPLGRSFVGAQKLDGSTLILLCGEFSLSLWRTEGTAATTTRLTTSNADLPCGFNGESLWPGFVAQGSHLYFMTRARGTRISLWRTDGMAAGTVPVSVGTGFEDPAELALLGDKILFTQRDEDHGLELWASDGTSAGTALLRDILPGNRSSSPAELTAVEGVAYFAANDGGHGAELWRTDGTAEGTRLVHDLHPGAGSSNPSGLTVVGDWLYFSADDGLVGQELWKLPLSRSGGSPCRASQEALCLKDERFKVETRWRDFAGRTGIGQAIPLTEDTGTFWFFDEENIEVILKVLDGRGLNNHFWTFYGALSNVEYYLTVTDSQTGLTRRYFNPSRTFASVGDTQSFGPQGAGRSVSPPLVEGEPASMPEILETTVAAAGSCVATATRLCLGDGRFAVEASWEDFSGNTGVGTAVSLTGDTGYFWFFNSANVEAVLKILDGRANNGNFWVFYGSLSNVDFDLTVTDTETGRVKTYLNRNQEFGSVGDTAAFPGE